MTVLIIYSQFLDANGKNRRLGGIETYLWRLSQVINAMGQEAVLYQHANAPFETHFEHLKIVGVPFKRSRSARTIQAVLYEEAMSAIHEDEDILLFGADHTSVKTNYPRAVLIQHGIAWDLPGRFLRFGRLGKLPFIPDWYCKRRLLNTSRRNFNNCRYRVCVDHNFINWYRTQVDEIVENNIWVIPNFAEVPFQLPARANNSKTRIIFARRFEEYRGLQLMIEITKQLLREGLDIEVCFAGEGPGECLLRQEFLSNIDVSITKYDSTDTIKVHSTFDIAVVPSLASEGTSLAVIEAMAAGCAVVATNVGGVTNLILDGFNGRLVSPNVDDVESAVRELVTHADYRRELGRNAFRVARQCFSLPRWEKAWSQVLSDVANA